MRVEPRVSPWVIRHLAQLSYNKWSYKTPSEQLPQSHSWKDTADKSRLVSKGKVLDLACGSGRHLRYCLERGHAVVGVDVDLRRVEDLRENSNVELIEADLEVGSSWPVTGRRFAAVIVCNYLYRPKFTELLTNVDVGGMLIYETFAVGNERYGRPRNQEYLLAAGELLELVSQDQGMYVMSYEHGLVHRQMGSPVDSHQVHDQADSRVDGQVDRQVDRQVRLPKPAPGFAIVQRICAVRLKPGEEFFCLDFFDRP